MKVKKQTRKEFLNDVSKLGAATLVGATWLSACSSPSGQSESSSAEAVSAPPTEPEPAAEEEPAPTQLAADACEDLSGLTEQELAMREQLKYVAQSEKEGQVCTNCRFWQAPETEGSCGGCQLIKGPIHPNGWCASWVAMPADAS